LWRKLRGELEITLMSYTATIDEHLQALDKKFGEDVAPTGV
jgi:hypothetical protein